MVITDNHLRILSEIECNDNRAVIVKVIPRADYVKIDAILSATGGKWNKKAKAHVWPVGVDATSAINAVIETGSIKTLREIKREFGAFMTPMPIARDLVAWADIEKGDSVLEPSAGTGRIVDAIVEVGGIPYVCERDEKLMSDLLSRLGTMCPYGFFREDDFMKTTMIEEKSVPYIGWTGFDAVVMNPPFTKSGESDHIGHVRHAFDFLREGGRLVSVLPASVVWRVDKKHEGFRGWVKNLGGEFAPLPDDSFAESGTRVKTVVLKITK